MEAGLGRGHGEVEHPCRSVSRQTPHPFRATFLVTIMPDMIDYPEDVLPLSPPVFHVLLALGDQALHGYGIMEAFEAATNGRETLLAGSLYATLRRMTHQGLVEEAESPPGETSGGPRRRYYRVTDLGRQVAHAESGRLQRLLDLARDRDLAPEAG